MTNIILKFWVSVAASEFFGVSLAKILAVEAVPISDTSTVTLAILCVAVGGTFTVASFVSNLRSDNRQLRREVDAHESEIAFLKKEVEKLRIAMSRVDHRHQRIDRGQPLDDDTSTDVIS